MFIQCLTLELSDRIASDDFAQIARHPDYPRAFTRNRKLPLPALIGEMPRGQVLPFAPFV